MPIIGEEGKEQFVECTECTFPLGQHEIQCPFHTPPTERENELSAELAKRDQVIADLKAKLQRLNESRYEWIITPDITVSLETNRSLATTAARSVMTKLHLANPDAVLLVYNRAMELMSYCNSLMDMTARAAIYEKKHVARVKQAEKYREEASPEVKEQARKNRDEVVAKKRVLTEIEKLMNTIRKRIPGKPEEFYERRAKKMMELGEI